MKRVLIGIMICYISVVLILVIFNVRRATQKFHFSSNIYYTDNINILKDKVSNINTNDECINALNDYIDISYNTYMTGDIELNKFYNTYTKYVLFNNYDDIVNNCNIDLDTSEYLKSLYLASTVYPDIMMSRLSFIHEISIVDYMNNNSDKSLMSNDEYQNIKNREIVTLKYIIDYLESLEV